MKELPNPTFALSPLNLPRGSLHQRSTEVAQASVADVAPAGIEVAWAKHLHEVRQAQRLRYEVFAGEMGARLSTTLPGHDVDLFDDYCEHLLVRQTSTGKVIGTYRVLTPVQAERVGSTYSDTEFDLTRLRGLRDRMVELGRSCAIRWPVFSGFEVVTAACRGNVTLSRQECQAPCMNACPFGCWR